MLVRNNGKTTLYANQLHWPSVRVHVYRLLHGYYFISKLLQWYRNYGYSISQLARPTQSFDPYLFTTLSRQYSLPD